MSDSNSKNLSCSSVITASVMRDDSGEKPAFCLMVAYRDEKDAMAALDAITEPKAPPAETTAAQGVPGNFVTHRAAWRNALTIARFYAVGADTSYWDHELAAFDRSFDRLWALIQAAPKAASDVGAGGWRGLANQVLDSIASRHVEEILQRLHDLLYTAQRTTGEVQAQAITDARILLSKSRAAGTRHADDVAVDRFAVAMKDKLAQDRDKGRSGWDTPECTRQRLSDMLREHVAKGDPRDVANFCMFLWGRGEVIAAAPQQEAPAGATPAPTKEWCMQAAADEQACNAQFSAGVPPPQQEVQEPVAWFTDWLGDGRRYAEKPHGFNEPGVLLDDADLIREVWQPLYTAPQPAPALQSEVLRDLLQVATAYFGYINALPADVVASLPAMPGVDGGWAEGVMHSAAIATQGGR